MAEGSTGGGVGLPTPPPATPDATLARVVMTETPWCVECKRMAPVVDSVAAAHPDVLFERVDVSGRGPLAEALGVMATPTLIGFNGDIEVGRVTGRRGRDEIERFFTATESGSRPSRTSRTEVTLRVGTGILLAALGALAGPSWPLVSIGAGLGGYGLLGLIPRRR